MQKKTKPHFPYEKIVKILLEKVTFLPPRKRNTPEHFFSSCIPAFSDAMSINLRVLIDTVRDEGYAKPVFPVVDTYYVN